MVYLNKKDNFVINLVRLLINFNFKEFLMTSTFSSTFFYVTDYNNGPL